MTAINNPARTNRAHAARAFLIGSLAVSTWIGAACYAQTAQQGPTQHEAGLPKLTYSANALSLQQIQDIAATRNPALLAARQNLEGVRAQEIQARRSSEPILHALRNKRYSSSRGRFQPILLFSPGKSTVRAGRQTPLEIGRCSLYDRPDSRAASGSNAADGVCN